MNESYYKRFEPFFGSWYITRLIGEGSYGKVFEIEKRDIKTYKSALKVISIPANEDELRDTLSDGMTEAQTRSYYQSYVEQLVAEYDLMNRLKGHTNIVSYEDHQLIEHKDRIGWDIFIRMELLTPLKAFVRSADQEQKLTRRDIIKLGIDLCKALELCQKYNIIHRDIKPENIFVADSGDYKLGDFGVARTIEQTQGNYSKKGTYNYMAPEVYKGESYGSTVDIYSLGIVLYQLLNKNRLPLYPNWPDGVTFTDREKALEKRMQGAPLPPPINSNGRLTEIVLKACAYNPEKRYRTPGEMRQDLEAIQYTVDEGRYIYQPNGDVVDNPPTTNPPYEEKPSEETKPKPSDESQIDLESDDNKTVSEINGTVSDIDRRSCEDPGKVKPKTDAKKKIFAPIIIGGIALAVCIIIGVFTYKQIALQKNMEQYTQLVQQANDSVQQNPETAMQTALQAQALLPEQASAYEAYAYALYQSQDFAKCASYCKEQLAAFPQSTNLQAILASAYFEFGEYEQSADLYQSLSENSEYEMKISNLRDYAVCLARLGRLDEAATVFVMLTDKGASADVTDYVLGETYYAKQDYSNAESAFQNALQTTADDTLRRRCYMSLAETYREMQDYDSEINIIEKAATVINAASNTVFLEMKGMAYYQRGEQNGASSDYLAAGKAFEQVIAAGVQKEYLFVDAFTAYQKAENYESAANVLAQMKEIWPNSYQPYALDATLMIIQENEKPESSRSYTAAYEEYQKACEMVTSSDDTTQLQQLDGLIQQLKNGGWL